MFGAYNSLLWSQATAVTGEIKPFSGTVLPANFLWCDGSSLSRSQYPKLFSVIGTSFGSVDSNSFNLPDFRGQFLRGRIPSTLLTITGSGTVVTNNATFTGHTINRTGLKVRLSSGTLTGLAVSTDYFVIVVDANTLAFATSLSNAIAGTKIAISGTNAAVLTQWEDPDAITRVGSVGGSSGANIGTRQDNDIKAHTHSVIQGGDGAAVGSSLQRTINNFGTVITSTTGGNESRPSNVAVEYIIRY